MSPRRVELPTIELALRRVKGFQVVSRPQFEEVIEGAVYQLPDYDFWFSMQRSPNLDYHLRFRLRAPRDIRFGPDSMFTRRA